LRIKQLFDEIRYLLWLSTNMPKDIFKTIQLFALAPLSALLYGLSCRVFGYHCWGFVGNDWRVSRCRVWIVS